MANKNRILCLLNYLQSHSDEEHAVTTTEIRDALSEKGCAVTTETLRSDITALKEAGYDIAVNEFNGLATTYSYVDRPLDAPEIQILIDAVSSAQFISKTRSRQLISKLISMAGPSHRDALKPGILISDVIKTPNSQLLYTVQRIQQAIKADSKITFQYYQYDLNKERVPRHDGKWYVISPYATIWKRERYFLVGWSDEREKAVIFRIDRMGMPKLTRQPRFPEPASFDVRDYTRRVFGMYDDGEMRKVTLRCRHNMMDHIIDYFGKDITLTNVNDDTFDVNVSVCASATFFSWVMTYAGDMTIAWPPTICDAYAEALEEAIKAIPK